MSTPNKAKKSTYMLDTVTLRLRFPDFKISMPEFFKPAFYVSEQQPVYDFPKLQAFSKQGHVQYVQNGTAADKKRGTYKPQLTGHKRFKEDRWIYDLHVQFSVPKLIFNNNLQELGDENFNGTITILQRTLLRMGVEATEEKLRCATIVRADFAKNIPLPFPITAYDTIFALCKTDIGRGKEITMREHKNGGQVLHFYATSYDIVFYDKLKDITLPGNKAIDKDKLWVEKELIKRLSKDKEEVLRFEIRLGLRKLRSVISDISGSEKNKIVTFEDIFKKEVCKKALQRSWNEIASVPINQLALKLTKSTPEEVFNELIRGLRISPQKKAHSLKETLAKFALCMLISTNGARWTRDKIEKSWTGKSWERLSEEIKGAADLLKHVPESNSVGTIRTALDRFERYDWRPEQQQNLT